MNDEQQRAETSVQKFRSLNHRVDYYPGVKALEAIRRLRQKYRNESMRAVIDSLVVAGIKSYFPEKNGGASGN